MGAFEMLCLGSHGERLSARPPSLAVGLQALWHE
jgi:hypothetical protein